MKPVKSKSNVGNNKEGTITEKNNKASCYLVIRSHFSPESPIDGPARNSLNLFPLLLGLPFIVVVEPSAPHLHELHHNTRQMIIINYQFTVESHKQLRDLAISDEVLNRVHPRGSHWEL